MPGPTQHDWPADIPSVARKTGTLTLNGATPVIVNDNRITAVSMVFFSVQNLVGTLSMVYKVDQIAGVSFRAAGLVLNTSTVAYEIVEP